MNIQDPAAQPVMCPLKHSKHNLASETVPCAACLYESGIEALQSTLLNIDLNRAGKDFRDYELDYWDRRNVAWVNNRIFEEKLLDFEAWLTLHMKEYVK